MKAVIEKIKKAKILTPLKIGLLVTLLNTLLLLLHYRNPGSIYDVIEPIEQKLYDIRYRIRGHIPHSGQVGILAADDKSIEKFGRWPFPRNIYPKIFENLQQAGVEWVGFDVFFSEPSRRYLDESSHELKLLFKDSSGKSYEAAKAKIDDLLKTSPGDIALQQGIDKFKNVVQGFFFIDNPNNIFNSSYDYQTSFSLLKNSALEFIDLPKDMSLKDYEDAASLGVVTNTKFIAGKALHMGFANNMPDTDGLVRKYRLVEIINPIDQNRNYFSEPILVPSLGLSLAANYLKSGIVAHFDTHGLNELELVPEDSSQKSTKIPLYAQSASAMLINHYGSFSDLPQISLADAYDNKFPKQMPKILIYGGTGTGTNDKRPNPFDKHFDGVGFHATAVENILNHNFSDFKICFCSKVRYFYFNFFCFLILHRRLFLIW